LRYYHIILLGELRNTVAKISVRVVNVPANIYVEDLHIIDQKHSNIRQLYHYFP